MTLTTTISTAPAPLRPFLQYIADRSANDNQRHGAAPRLFATHTARDGTRRRVRCVTASRLGRVGITERLADDTTPQEYVPAGSLSQFLPTPYPTLPPPAVGHMPGQDRRRQEARLIAAARIARLRRTLPVDGVGVVDRAASILGVSAADIRGECKEHLLVFIRRALVGMLAARRPEYSLSMLGSFINVHHSSVHHALVATGLRGDAVNEFDAPYLRAMWSRLPMPIGYGPGEVPAETAMRLGRLVTVKDGMVEPAIWRGLRRWLAAHALEESYGDLKCAA